jgi:hypothetical protein
LKFADSFDALEIKAKPVPKKFRLMGRGLRAVAFKNCGMGIAEKKGIDSSQSSLAHKTVEKADSRSGVTRISGYGIAFHSLHRFSLAHKRADEVRLRSGVTRTGGRRKAACVNLRSRTRRLMKRN